MVRVVKLGYTVVRVNSKTSIAEGNEAQNRDIWAQNLDQY